MKNIKEIIYQAIEENRFKFQFVNDSMVGIKKTKNGSRIEIDTHALSATDIVTGRGPTGIIFWIDEDLINENN